jgi:hypothetical protein
MQNDMTSKPELRHKFPAKCQVESDSGPVLDENTGASFSANPVIICTLVTNQTANNLSETIWRWKRLQRLFLSRRTAHRVRHSVRKTLMTLCDRRCIGYD